MVLGMGGLTLNCVSGDLDQGSKVGGYHSHPVLGCRPKACGKERLTAVRSAAWYIFIPLRQRNKLVVSTPFELRTNENY